MWTPPGAGALPAIKAAVVPRRAGPIRRWRAVLAKAVARVAEHVKTQRRRARDRQLVASFNDYKLRDIGLDRPDRLG